MFSRKLLVLSLTALLIFAMVSDTVAGVSNAAALFLRIAPGSRPAGMGEAYVAIADDASATHWNPAGLGTYPMSDSWQEVKIPAGIFNLSNDVQLNGNILKAIAPLKSGAGNDFKAYDLWVLTTKGLARYDNKRWNDKEIFNTKTNQTIKSIVASYFGITDNEVIDVMAKKVADANNIRTYEQFNKLRQDILSQVPEDYEFGESLTNLFDSLDAAYYGCLINWERYINIEDEYKSGMKDSTLSEKELDKINFTVEKAKSRFLPEELKVPYSIIFDSEPTSVVTSDNDLAFGTDKGLILFNGRRWRIFNNEDQLPSINITSLAAVGHRILVGTDKGIAVYEKGNVVTLTAEGDLPEGLVSAMTAKSLDDIWVVINNDLYHYDGQTWANSYEYTVNMDDSKDKIASRMTLYGSSIELTGYLEKLEVVNKLTYENEVRKRLQEAVGNLDNKENSEENSETVEENKAFSFESIFDSGQVVRVPYLNNIKGDVTSIRIDDNKRIWIGTEYGIIMYDGIRWSTPGYRSFDVESGQTIADLVAMKTHADETAALNYEKTLKEINDLTSETISESSTIKVYRNPASAVINDIAVKGDIIYFATENGLIEFDNGTWRRVELQGLENTEVSAIGQKGNEIWFASNEKIVIKANGRPELSLMHVKWLPELADDIYYEFMSYVFNKEGWGTFGISPTFITYGTIFRTGEGGIDLGSFEAFDFALTLSYGTSLSKKLKGGISSKIIYSKLSEQGAGLEQGKGTATAFALDFGLLYAWNDRLNLGMAITNIGPDISYIDAVQADALPRNFALGFAYKLLRSDYYQLLATVEVNKLLVNLEGFNEIKTSEGLIINGGAEFQYADIFSIRGGYIYDDEGKIKTMTIGFGFKPMDWFSADFAYIPDNGSDNVVLANTLRMSLSILP